MKKLVNILMLFVMMLAFSSCASTCQRMKANGAVVGSISGDWIVIKQSGGKITDVFKLENIMVQSEGQSDGWLFIDRDGNPVHIGGDMKAIRVTNNKKAVFDSYIEYHMEHDSLTYQDKYKYYRKIFPINQ
jgi:hypothetical protein